MRTISVLFLGILFACISCKQDTPEHNVLTQAEIDQGWILLFDGQRLDQWRSYLKEDLSGWVVEDGTMKALGLGGDAGGDIITLKKFENFELSLDFKIAPAGNSGILYMVHEDSIYAEVYHTGPEYQVLDDIGFPQKLSEVNLVGSNYDMHPAEGKEVKTAGEWNTARIIKDGALVQHWLNGKKVVEYELWTAEWKELVENCKWKNYPGYGQFKKGHIALQDHGSEAWYRNVKIREL